MKTKPYNIFWQHIHKSAKEKAFPLRVMFELTYRCNFHCKHCYVPQSYKKGKGELKTKEVFSILKQLKDIGCFYLGFTGGEPFMRKDILDILWYAKRCGFEVIIYTNGSLINEKIAQELAHLRPNKVDITIPAMSKENFEQITQMPGSYKKVFGAIDFLYKKRVNLGFKSCVLKENEDEIKDIQDFAASLGALHRLDDMLSPRLDGSKEPYKYSGILKEDSATRHTPHATRHTLHARDCTLQNLDATDLKQNSKNQSPINQLTNHQELFKCGVGVSQAAITPFGELKMCVMIDYPKYKICMLHASRYTPDATLHQDAGFLRGACSLRHEAYNLKDAWERLKELVASIKPDKDYKCNRCELKPYCKWCPASGWLYNRIFTSCEPESRTFAEIRSQRSEFRNQKTDVRGQKSERGEVNNKTQHRIGGAVVPRI